MVFSSSVGELRTKPSSPAVVPRQKLYWPRIRPEMPIIEPLHPHCTHTLIEGISGASGLNQRRLAIIFRRGGVVLYGAGDRQAYWLELYWAACLHTPLGRPQAPPQPDSPSR